MKWVTFFFRRIGAEHYDRERSEYRSLLSDRPDPYPYRAPYTYAKYIQHTPKHLGDPK